MNRDTLKDLIKLANHFDRVGMKEKADFIDQIIKESEVEIFDPLKKIITKSEKWWNENIAPRLSQAGQVDEREIEYDEAVEEIIELEEDLEDCYGDYDCNEEYVDEKENKIEELRRAGEEKYGQDFGQPWEDMRIGRSELVITKSDNSTGIDTYIYRDINGGLFEVKTKRDSSDRVIDVAP